MFGLLIFLGSCATVPRYDSGRRGFFDEFESASRSPTVNQDDLERLRPVVAEWVWPLTHVVITSQFGYRSGDFHEGIDLRAKPGTPIYAVESGRVLYAASRIRGYGQMVVIKHRDSLSTVYAHNSRSFVKRGQWVSKGQKIALSGSSGRARGPHLHFELRLGYQAIDPLSLLHPSLARAKPVGTKSRRREVASNGAIAE